MGGDSASNIRIQASGEVRASLDIQTGPDGTPVIVRASLDVVENPVLSKWYKAPNQDELKMYEQCVVADVIPFPVFTKFEF